MKEIRNPVGKKMDLNDWSSQFIEQETQMNCQNCPKVMKPRI